MPAGDSVLAATVQVTFDTLLAVVAPCLCSQTQNDADAASSFFVLLVAKEQIAEV